MARLSNRIDAHLLRKICDYDPIKGKLRKKKEYKHLPLSAASGNTLSVYGVHYSMQNLVYAWHNPDEPQPQWVKFIDGNPRNTRIENLYPFTIDKNWLARSRGGIKCHMDDMGRVTRIYNEAWMPDFQLTHCPHCKKQLLSEAALPNDTPASPNDTHKPAPTLNGFEDFDAELEAEMNKLRVGI